MTATIRVLTTTPTITTTPAPSPPRSLNSLSISKPSTQLWWLRFQIAEQKWPCTKLPQNCDMTSPGWRCAREVTSIPKLAPKRYTFTLIPVGLLCAHRKKFIIEKDEMHPDCDKKKNDFFLVLQKSWQASVGRWESLSTRNSAVISQELDSKWVWNPFLPPRVNFDKIVNRQCLRKT